MTGAAYGSNLIVTVLLVHLTASIVAVAWRSLRWTILALAVQSALLAWVLASFAALPGSGYLWLWAATVVATKVILVPALLWRYLGRVVQQEDAQVIGFRLSVFLVFVATVLFYSFMHRYVGLVNAAPEALGEPARSSLAIAFTVFALGLYVLVARRGAVKIVVGLVLMQNGVHLALVTLAPTLPETALLGMLTNVVVTAGLLLYLTGAVYREFRVADPSELSTLSR
jgi:hydrogenase-4 component E